MASLKRRPIPWHLSSKMCWQHGNLKTKPLFSDIHAWKISSLYQSFLQGEWDWDSVTPGDKELLAENTVDFISFSYYMSVVAAHDPENYSSGRVIFWWHPNLIWLAQRAVDWPEVVPALGVKYFMTAISCLFSSWKMVSVPRMSWWMVQLAQRLKMTTVLIILNSTCKWGREALKMAYNLIQWLSWVLTWSQPARQSSANVTVIYVDRNDDGSGTL